MYSDILLDHFDNPRNCGDLTNADAEAADENPICGDRLHLWLSIQEGQLQRMTWQAEGCAAAIAAASVVSELLPGMTLEKARILDRDAVIDALGGLPARKSHAALLVISTLHKALDGYDRNGDRERV